MSAKLKRKLEKDEREIRLVNWARWANAGNKIDLGYPDWYDIWAAYLPAKTTGQAIAEQDAQHIEEVITTLDLCGRECPEDFTWHSLWAYVIKVEYLWIPRPVELRARLVRHKFKRPCARRTYHYHVERATEAIFSLAKSL